MPNVVTYIDVQPSSTNEAIALLKQYREGNVREAGHVSTHVLQEISRQNRFVIVEEWNDEASMQARENAEHRAEFRSRLRVIHNSPYDQRLHLAFAVGEHASSEGPGAFHVVTHVDVPPPRREETEVLLRSLAEQGRADMGNLRFDVSQQLAPRTNHFTVFAVWENEPAFTSHQAQPHTRQFREALGPMLGAPYDERLFIKPA
jgi:quinol monooxygenase YgiN